MMLTAATSAWATNYVKDVMLIGGSKSEVNSLKETYTGQGWTFIDYDLNKGCGTTSDYIYLLCKIESSDDTNLGYITDLYLSSQGGTAPDKLTHGERTYNLAPYDGGEHFKSKKGDLNSNASGDDIHLYYTRDLFSDTRAVSNISFNDTQSGAVGKDGTSTGYDLNAGCGSGTAYIYMHITTAKTKPVVVLTEETREVTIPDGYTVTGTGNHLSHVCIADGATVTLGGITLNGKNWEITPWAGITCLGDATLVLAEGTTNNVGTDNYYHQEYPGIYVPEGKTLTIQGEGALNAKSCWGACIGGGYYFSCGNIIIEAGTVNATSWDGAGIGSGSNASCGDITIKGGTVNARSEYSGAGIGSGWQGSCGNITIEEGITKVIAFSKDASPIGAGEDGSCGTITIAENLNDVTEGKTRTLTPKKYTIGLTSEYISIPTIYAGVANNLMLEVKNISGIAGSNIIAQLYISEELIGEETIEDLPAGEEATLEIVDPTIRPITENTIIGRDNENTIYRVVVKEDNNVMAQEDFSFVILYNGNLGKEYAYPSLNPTMREFSFTGDVKVLVGSNYYSASDTSKDESFAIALDGNSTYKALLYVPYNWDKEPTGDFNNWTTKFNGVSIAPLASYRDQGNLGTYGAYGYGMVVYDVTDNVVDGDNTFTLAKAAGFASVHPSTLIVMTNNSSAKPKAVYICEEADLLSKTYNKNMDAIYPSSFQDVAAGNAQLYVFAVNAQAGEGDVIINDTRHQDVWTGTSQTTEVFEIPVTSGDISIQFQGTGSTIMALHQMVVVECEPDGIETCNAAPTGKAQKRVENGRLLIEKDGKKYDVTGRVIKD